MGSHDGYSHVRHAMQTVLGRYEKRPNAIVLDRVNIPSYGKLSSALNWRGAYDWYPPSVQLSYSHQMLYYDGDSYSHPSLSINSHHSADLVQQWSARLSVGFSSRTYSYFRSFEPRWHYSLMISKSFGAWDLNLDCYNVGVDPIRRSERIMRDIAIREAEWSDNAGVRLAITYRFMKQKGKAIRTESPARRRSGSEIML